MRAIVQLLSGYVTWLCQELLVTPDLITKDRRGNLPPPSGGIGAY